MTRGSIRIVHTKECPAEGYKPQSKICRCAPRVRIRLAGRDYTVGHLQKGWKLEDLEPFDGKLVEMRDLLDSGVSPAPRKTVTLGEYALPWFQNLHAAARAGSIAPRTFNTYEGDWRLHIGPFFKSYPLAAIDVALINRYVDKKLEAGYSKNKVTSSLTVLSAMLTDAAGESPPLIPGNPMRSPKRGRHGSRRVGVQAGFERKQPKHLELDSAIALLELAPVEVLDIILNPLVTGARRMEIAGAEWAEIQWGQQVYEIGGQLYKPKGRPVEKAPCKYHSERIVPLVPCFAAALGRRRGAHGWIYTTSTGAPYNETTIKDLLDDLYVQLGLKPDLEERRRRREEREARGLKGVVRDVGLGWHALRHTYNSVLAQAGIPRHVREELMGHKKQDVTGRYEHVMSGDFERVREVLEEAYGDVVRRRLDLPAAAADTSKGDRDPEVTPREGEPMGTHGSSPMSEIRQMRL
jgi:integrase